MAADTKLDKVVEIGTGLPAVVEKTEWESLPEVKRSKALLKFTLLGPVFDKIKIGIEETPAIRSLMAQIQEGSCEQRLIDIAYQLGRGGKPPSKASFNRWLNQYEANGLLGLADNNKGRQAKPKDWHPRGLYWQQKPSKMLPGAIAQVLCAEGFNVTDAQVRRWLKSLPDDVRNRRRMGSKFYRDTQMPSRLRNTDVVEVGEIYQGDGHTIDVYLAHPSTGKPWRAELTVWIDVRSRYIAGAYLSEAESSTSTLYSLSQALLKHDHVPAGLHIDNGSGYKSQMMNDEVVGFYSRFEISRMYALPGNSKGKGQVERFFLTQRNSFDKRWDSYCGDDMAPEAIKRVLKDAQQGKKPLPDARDYLLALHDWIEEYHHRPHRGLNGKTPADMWSQLVRTPLYMTEAAVVRPRIKRTIRRGSLRLHNREYRHPELQAFNQREIIIEYDLMNDASIIALTDDGRKICEPTLTQKIDYLPASRLEEMKQRRVKGQVRRLELHIEEKKARGRDDIDHSVLADYILDDGRTPVLEEITQHTLELMEDEEPAEPTPEDKDLDIYDTNYNPIEY